MLDLLSILVSAVETGCIYALVALAYYLVLRPSGIINFASGDLAMIGGMMGVAYATWLGLPFAAVLVLSALSVGLISLGTERLVVRSLVGRGAPIAAIILALLGAMFVYRESAALAFGLDVLRVDPPFGYGVVDLGVVGPAHTSDRRLHGRVFIGFACSLDYRPKAYRAIAMDRLAALSASTSPRHGLVLRGRPSMAWQACYKRR